MKCRSQCGACCIAPSISSPIPGMPNGKPAGVPCINLTDDLGCALWGDPERPAVCAQFKPEPDICGSSAQDALRTLTLLEAS